MKPRHRPTWIAIATLLAGVTVGVLWRREQPPSKRQDRNQDEATGVKNAGPQADNAVQERSSADTSSKVKSAATVDRLKRLLAEIEPVLPGEVESAAALEILRWWAEIEPASAIAYAAGNLQVHGRGTLVVELFIAWLDAKPAEARAWFEGLEERELRAQVLPAVISILAQHQPEEALQRAGELAGESRRGALATLFTEWSSREPRKAAEAALRLADTREQNLALRRVLGKWMDGDMHAAIAWARQLPLDPPSDSFHVLPPVRELLVEKWAARAPAEAAAYLLSVADSGGRSDQLRMVAAQWAQLNPAEAMQWTVGVANEADRRGLVRGVVAAVAENDRRSGAELALTAPHPGDAEHGLSLVMDQWQARDPAGLADWVTAMGGQPDSRLRMKVILTTWTATDASAVERWVGDVAPSETRDAGLVALSEYLETRDVERARHWAGLIADPLKRGERMDGLGARR